MRAAALMVALALADCRATGPGLAASNDMQKSAVSYRLVDSGNSGRLIAGAAAARTPFVEVFGDQNAYRAAWNRDVAPTEPPAIDFARETAVFLFLGMRNTGGYDVEVTGVSMDDGCLIVDSSIKQPLPGGMVTQELSAPWALIAVTGRPFRDVRWLDRGKREVASTSRRSAP